MINISLDGKLINNKTDLFKAINNQISQKEFPITNLDALYDVITFLNKELIVTIENDFLLRLNLGEYYNWLIDTINDYEKIKIIKNDK